MPPQPHPPCPALPRPAPPCPALQWLCAPRGSAFLHVQPRHQAHVRPLVISHGWGSGFVSEFVWTGAADYAPLLGVSAALRAWRQLGPEAVRAHQRELLRAATALLASSWGTGGLASAEGCRLPAAGWGALGGYCWRPLFSRPALQLQQAPITRRILLYHCHSPRSHGPSATRCRPACATRHVRRRHGAGAAASGMRGGGSRGGRCRRWRRGRGRTGWRGGCHLSGCQMGAGLSALPTSHRVPCQVHSRRPLCSHLRCVLWWACALRASSCLPARQQGQPCRNKRKQRARPACVPNCSALPSPPLVPCGAVHLYNELADYESLAAAVGSMV